MDSANWRIKREPSGKPSTSNPREHSRRDSRSETGQSSGWGSRRGRGEGVQPSQVTFETSYPTFQQADQGDDELPQYDQGDGLHQYHQVDGLPQYDQSDGFQRLLDDSKEEQAIEEGRKLWLGSLPYEATFKDIEALLKPAAEEIEAISFSIDRFTRRNPGYCFVYLKTKQDARQVMKMYHSKLLLGRPIKVDRAFNSGTGTGRFHLQPRSGDGTHLETNQERNSTFAFDRWRSLESPEDIDKAAEEGRRLHVSGLPYLGTQANADATLRYMFTGFEVEVVSKMLRPPERKRLHDDYYWYCFIDLGSAEEAQRAMEALDGNKQLDREVKIALAKSTSRKLHERERLFVSGLPVFSTQQDLEDGIRELFQGFGVSSVSELMFPKDNSGGSNGRCYCFVELATAEDADKAMLALDWKEIWVGKVRVKPATSSRRG